MKSEGKSRMARISERIYFNRIPAGASLAFRGRVYDAASGESQPEAAAAIAARPEMLNDLEADLALVSFDPAKGRWRLLRDFGQTPLYYTLFEDGFAWSFTYKGILELMDRPEPDEATMFDYLATHYRYIFRDPGRTFHKGVRQVPPGCCLDLDVSGNCEISNWLDLSHNPEIFRLGPDEATERLMEIIKRSVRLRAAAAAKPAFTVSSGLDSSTVASLASQHLGPIDVFSVGYEGPGSEEYDETAGIAELVKGKDWRWTNLIMEHPDLLAETDQLIQLTGSPVVTVTWLAYYLAARRFGDFAEAFNGIGGDESLAGEFGHFFYFFADLKKNGDTERLRRETEAWSRLHDHPIHKKNQRVLDDFWRRNIDFDQGRIRVDQAVYRANWRFFNDDWLNAHGLDDPPMPCPYPNFLSSRLYQEICYETTPPTLWGLFMANQALGLTGVSPLMSTALFRLCLSLPGTVKYDNGLTKALLRRGLKGILPESLRLNIKKTGFNAPIHQWFGEPQVAKPTWELLKEGPLSKKGWLQKGAADKIFQEHMSGQANHMMLLWPLLNASLFLK